MAVRAVKFLLPSEALEVHPDKDSGTEQKDRFMQNFVKSGTAAAVHGLSADKDP